MADAFYEPLGEGRYRSTEHTVGPWGPDSQHGGPPSALLTRALESMPASWPGTLARVSVDILGAVPVAELTVRTRTLRPGRSVELVEAELESGGRPVLRAQAWRVVEGDLADLPPALHTEPVPEFATQDGPFYDWDGGYLQAMQWRFAPGAQKGVGHSAVWARMRIPLVPDEEPSGLQRMMTLADSGSGVSHRLDPAEWMYINPELTVHVAAPAAGEWLCLEGTTHLDPAGFGLASSRIFDRDRLVGVGAQSLFVRRRA
jgi:hypothetical protein